MLEGLAAEPGFGPQAHHLLPAGRVRNGPLVLMPGSALHLWEMCKIEGLGLINGFSVLVLFAAALGLLVLQRWLRLQTLSPA